MPRKVPPSDIIQALYSELETAHVSASGPVGVLQGGRLFFLHAYAGESPGYVELRDGAGGPLKMRIDLPAAQHVALSLPFPAYFANGIYVVLSNAKANLQHGR